MRGEHAVVIGYAVQLQSLAECGDPLML